MLWMMTLAPRDIQRPPDVHDLNYAEFKQMAAVVFLVAPNNVGGFGVWKSLQSQSLVSIRTRG